MFHASPLTSDRIQRVLTVLRQRPATTLELNELCGSTRASSDVSECRANGCVINAEYVGTNETGRRVYRYHLVSEPVAEVAA